MLGFFDGAAFLLPSLVSAACTLGIGLAGRWRTGEARRNVTGDGADDLEEGQFAVRYILVRQVIVRRVVRKDRERRFPHRVRKAAVVIGEHVLARRDEFPGNVDRKGEILQRHIPPTHGSSGQY